MLYVIRYTYAKQNKKKGEKNMTYDMFDINKSYRFYTVSSLVYPPIMQPLACCKTLTTGSP